ncbi:rhodanese-like domain-containing protein [Arcticibacter eurypsychrophilus]|uniref:rhodanese-like domain-containing protein n=1 Tax=Arcticibacter eurypsychrophilus TaxID=1434752 RepID=UPI00084E0405|nr:hypothetical protein [Arcticibacter eurypsychrophilus]
MKTATLTSFIITLLLILSCPALQAQSVPGAGNPSWKTNEPWKNNQLMQPSTLAAILNNPKAKKPLIFNIGVVENIKGARNIGAASVQKNLIAFKTAVRGVPKNAAIVVYCGCCPFNKCPNIRPAIIALNELGYSNAKLLNLATNIKVDWINKGYPLSK